MRYLFVCTGNTCRSPMAAALMRRALDAAGRTDDEVDSAGIFAVPGGPMSDNAVRVMGEMGLDISRQRTQTLDQRRVEESVVLTMTSAQKAIVLRELPHAQVVTVGEYAGHSGDIPDPYGQSIDAYRRTARCLADLIETIRYTEMRMPDHQPKE